MYDRKGKLLAIPCFDVSCAIAECHNSAWDAHMSRAMFAKRVRSDGWSLSGSGWLCPEHAKARRKRGQHPAQANGVG